VNDDEAFITMLVDWTGDPRTLVITDSPPPEFQLVGEVTAGPHDGMWVYAPPDLRKPQ
jgi:hypothetical protein